MNTHNKESPMHIQIAYMVCVCAWGGGRGGEKEREKPDVAFSGLTSSR